MLLLVVSIGGDGVFADNGNVPHVAGIHFQTV